MAAPIASGRIEVPLLSPGGMQTYGNDRKVPWLENLITYSGAQETRSGFGQIDQITLDGNSNILAGFGYVKCLGSTAIITDFGHVQIISAHLVRHALGGLTAQYSTNSVSGSCYCITVYDVDTNTFIQEILKPHTSTVGDGVKRNSHPVFSSSIEYSSMAIHPETEESQFIFMPGLDDSVLLLHKAAGWWSYFPTVLPKQRHFEQAENHLHAPAISGKGEASFIVPVPATKGAGPVTAYLTNSTRPAPTAACILQSRHVYANGREVYFTDPNAPSTTYTKNFVTCPSDNPITALATVGDAVLVFTVRETWYYRISTGDVLSLGQWIQVSSSIGCVSQQAITDTPAGPVWIDANNAYTTQTGLTITPIGTAIQQFWTEGLSSPKTSYFLKTGRASTAASQPHLSYYFKDVKDLSVIYFPRFKSVYFTFPSQGISLVFNNGWSIWNYESACYAQSGVSEVGVRRRLGTPTLIPLHDRLFMHGGLFEDSIVDTSPRAVNFTARSIAYLEYGRGGSLDRTSTIDEDARLGRVVWEKPLALSNNNPAFYCELERAEAGYTFVPESPDVAAAASVTTTDETYFLKVSLQPGINRDLIANPFPGINRYALDFNFDNTKFTPVYAAAAPSAALGMILPSTNVGNRAAFHFGGADVGYCYEIDGAGIPTRGTGRIRIEYMHSQSTHANSATLAPYLADCKSLLITIMFRRTAVTTAQNQLITNINIARVNEVAGPSVACEVLTHEKACLVRNISTSTTAQAIDWAIASSQIGMNKPVVMLSRGATFELISHAAADVPIEAGFMYGLFSVLLAVDGKEWTTQLIDPATDITVASLEQVVNKTTIRMRIRNPTTKTMTYKVFGNSAVTWGTTANLALGNYLIDSPAIDRIVVSQAARGETVSSLIFGFLRDPAENIKVLSAKATLLGIAPVRRFGH